MQFSKDLWIKSNDDAVLLSCCTTAAVLPYSARANRGRGTFRGPCPSVSNSQQSKLAVEDRVGPRGEPLLDQLLQGADVRVDIPYIPYEYSYEVSYEYGS